MPKVSPKHILVIRMSAMGDVAMTVPVLRAFTQQYPDVKLTVLTRAFFKPFFRDLLQIEVYEADLKDKHKGFFGLYELSKELRELHIDAIADLHNVLRSKLLKVFLLDKPIVQIDKGRKEKKALVSGQQFVQLKTTVQRYVDVFEALGFPIDMSQPNFPEPKVLSHKLDSLLGDTSRKLIGIAPFAAFEGKMYPLELMEQVIAELSKQHQVLLFGGGVDEVEKLRAIAVKFDHVQSVAGQLNLEEELDLISHLDVMLAMDSGNAHIAAMLGRTVVTLWGITHPYSGFAPFNQPLENTLLSNRNLFPLIPTSVYGNKCPENYLEAMQSIAPELVVAKLNRLLS